MYRRETVMNGPIGKFVTRHRVWNRCPCACLAPRNPRRPWLYRLMFGWRQTMISIPSHFRDRLGLLLGSFACNPSMLDFGFRKIEL